MLDKEAYYLMLISLWLPVAALKNIVKGLGIDPNGRQFSKPKQSLCCPDWLGFLGRKPLLELETYPPSRQVSDWVYYY